MREVLYPLAGKRVWVAGHRGMVGSALLRRLARDDCEILTADRAELDLRDQTAVRAWTEAKRPQVVILSAARAGGIMANATYPAQFLHDNLAIQTSVMEAARVAGVEKLLFLASSCIYPKFAPQPITEDALLTGPLEPNLEAYAIAKIAGVKLAAAMRREYGCDFISALPCNLYGPGDNFDPLTSHVPAALMRKAHQARLDGAMVFEVWGTGTPLREFLHVDDCADGLVFLLKHYSADSHINLGSGADVSIADFARLVARAVGFVGEVRFDPSKPDGAPRKLLSVAKLAELGWRARIGLEEGLADTYRWFLESHGAG